MGRSGELALTFESSERVASSAEATGGRELFSPLAHTREPRHMNKQRKRARGKRRDAEDQTYLLGTY